MENLGEQFLHKRNPSLHVSDPVEHEKERKERAGEETSQKPAEKITDWLKVIEKTHTGHRDDPRVLERIKESYHKEFVIKPEDISEDYFENRKRIASERGEDYVEITRDVIINDQKSTLDNWINYFTSPDSDVFPTWAKYWAFTSMVKLSTFDKEKHVFANRDKDTVAPFSDLNREALAYVLDAIVQKANKEGIPVAEDNPEFKKLLEGANFGKLYAYAIEKAVPTKEKGPLNTGGMWIKYPQGSDHTLLAKSLQGYGTNWCIAGEASAESYLRDGSMYVYYSYDTQGQPIIPRLAFTIKGENIVRIYGVAPGQKPDSDMCDIVDEKLTEFPNGKDFQRGSADTRRLIEIDRKNTAGEELTIDDLRFLYQLDSKIEQLGEGGDPKIFEIIATRDIKSDFSLITGYSKEQISTTEEEVLSGEIKFHYGNLDFTDSEWDRELTLPETVSGSLNFEQLKYILQYVYKTNKGGLILPKIIGGDINLGKLRSAEGLTLPKISNGNLNLNELEDIEGLILPETINELELNGLQSAEGLILPKKINNISLNGLKSAKGLILPEVINGYLSLDGLESAEGLILPEKTNGISLKSLKSAKGLKLPEIMSGSLDLSGLESTEELILPKIINGDINLNSLKSVEDLILPETVNGDLVLGSLENAKGLILPKTINGGLYCFDLKSAKGLTLPKIINGNLELNGLESTEELKLPETINGHLYLDGLQSAKGLTLPKIINGDLGLNGLQDAEGLIIPEIVENISLKNLKSAKGLILPKILHGDLKLNGLQNAEGLILPEIVYGNINLDGIRSIEGLILPREVSKHVYLSSLQPIEIEKLRIIYPQLQIS